MSRCRGLAVHGWLIRCRGLVVHGWLVLCSGVEKNGVLPRFRCFLTLRIFVSWSKW